MKANKKITINQPITDSYGLKENSKYLLYYGFTSDTFNENIDTVRINFKNLHQSKSLKYIKSKFLPKNNISEQIKNNISRHSLQILLSWARINVANKKEMNIIKKKYNTYDRTIPIINKRNEVAALMFIIENLKKKLKKYTFSLNQNKKMIKKYKKGSNQYFAIKLVIYEKKIIHSFINFLQTLVEHILFGYVISPTKLSESHLLYLNSIKNL